MSQSSLRSDWSRDECLKFQQMLLPTQAAMGIQIDAAGFGWCKLTLPESDFNLNHIETVSAPSLWTFAELPGGVIYYTSFDTQNFAPVIVESSLKFTKVARGPVTVEACMPEADIAAVATKAQLTGRAIYKLNTEIKDTEGQVVAVSTNVFMLIKNSTAKL